MHFFAYAAMLTVLGIWGGPYLYDVHKLDGVARGNVLLAMGLAQTLGILAYGPMDRVLRSRKKVVIGGTYISAGLFLRPGADRHARPLPVAIGLLVAVLLLLRLRHGDRGARPHAVSRPARPGARHHREPRTMPSVWASPMPSSTLPRATPSSLWTSYRYGPPHTPSTVSMVA